MKPTIFPAQELEGVDDERRGDVDASVQAQECGAILDTSSETIATQWLRIHPGLRAKIWTAIAEHVRDHGRRRWDLVRERAEFAHVIGKAAGAAGKRRFWRWVSAVCEPPPPDKTRPHEARGAATEALSSATERARLAAQRNLPAAPSPAYMARAGAQATQNIDFLAAVTLIWADAERLRELAMQPDETSPDGKRIADAKVFDASIRRRVEVMESALRVMQEIWDLNFQEQFYNAITEIIVSELEEVPDVQERVIRRLVDLNNSRGMTIHAEPR
jgi:hypothetical protein